MNKISIVLFAFLICSAFTSGFQIVQGSTIGVTWTKYSGNPFNLGASDVTEPWVIYSGSVFKMWYVGVASYSPFVCRIYCAVSTDGVNWAPQGVVLSEGEAGSWDDRVVSSPVVLFDGTTYRMWYIGVGGSASVYGMVGYATSSDGTNWTKLEGGPVLVPSGNGGWDDYNVGGLSVMFNGTHYMMWYGGQPGVDTQMRIGVATSVDGISWNKYLNNPILSPTSDWWEDRHVSPGPVIMNGSLYVMSYSGQGWSWPGNRVGIATSPDGFSWAEYEGNPVLDVGQPGSWDERTVSAHSIVRKDDNLLMWYTGANYDPAGHYSGIGLAISYSGERGPAINISSPENTTYTTNSVPLAFTIDVPTSWVGYSLDNQLNVTINGNTTINVEDGSHQIVVYANDASGIMGSSEIVTFAVDTTFHDIAVIGITLSKTVLGQGYSANITTTVSNLGNYTEAFIVDFYANATLIGKSASVTLPEGSSSNVVLTWNSAGYSKGVYTISAYAEPVPNEKDLADNNFTGSMIRVTVPGDVNGDFKVNCADLVKLLCSYGANPGSARWSPNCDINGDGKINCQDLAILLCHCGQHYL
jgi:hypothetical protein